MKKYYFLVMAFLFISLTAFSQDLVYKPKNPAFGGDTFNYQWLLSSAQAQDTFKDPDAQSTSYTRDPLADFEDNLNRQILYQLSRQLVTEQFGEGTIQPGAYEVGSYQIEITDGSEGLNISIVDVETGTQTSVIVPNN